MGCFNPSRRPLTPSTRVPPVVTACRGPAPARPGRLRRTSAATDADECGRAAAILRRRLAARAEAKGVALILDVASALPALDLDAARIAQVAGNLLDNAVTHTPTGGGVTVSAQASANGVQVVVTDTGPGISSDNLSRVFDRFYRADPSRSRNTGGTGLGLTIARRLVEAHGGTIEAESVVGQGSRFVIRLPGAQ